MSEEEKNDTEKQQEEEEERNAESSSSSSSSSSHSLLPPKKRVYGSLTTQYSDQELGDIAEPLLPDVSFDFSSINPKYISSDDFPADPETSSPLPDPPKIDRYGFIVTERYPAPKASRDAKTEREVETKWITFLRLWSAEEEKKAFVEKHRKKLVEACDQGIPDTVRGEVWKLLTDLHERKKERRLDFEALSNNTDTSLDHMRECIRKDSSRIRTNVVLSNEKGRNVLESVLDAFVAHDPDVGYCSGMLQLTANFFLFMSPEDAFHMLIEIGERWRFRDMWIPGFPLIEKSFYVFQKLLEIHLPRVHRHFEERQITPTIMFATHYISGFAFDLPFHHFLRIWDSILVRDFSFVHSVILALLKINESKLLQMDFDEVINFNRSPEFFDFNSDQLISLAVGLKIDSQRVSDLEDQFETEKKNKTMEEDNH